LYRNRNTRFVFISFPPKIMLLNRQCGTARKATDNNITQRVHIACWVTKAPDTHT